MIDFELLYRQYFRDVYLFILSMSQNESVAEEITQETFYKALKNLKSFRETCTIKVWLCQIAKNTYFTYLKKQERNVVHEQFKEPQVSNMEDIYIERNEALSIYKILHYLDEPYKEVFILRVLGDLSFREVGEIFDKGEGWARVTFHRAKRKVQEMVKEESEWKK